MPTNTSKIAKLLNKSTKDAVAFCRETQKIVDNNPSSYYVASALESYIRVHGFSGVTPKILAEYITKSKRTGLSSSSLSETANSERPPQHKPPIALLPKLRRSSASLLIQKSNETPVNQTLHLVARFQESPKGIRNYKVMQDVCIVCGSNNVRRPKKVKLGPNRECQACKSSWYVNHCWSCNKHQVDSRDPETPKCNVCHWQKCAFCKACDYGGCTTNEYSKHRKYTDAIKPMPLDDFDDLVPPEIFSRCDWCGAFPPVYSMPFGEICENCYHTI